MTDSPLTARVEALLDEIDRDPILIAPTWENYREAVRAKLTDVLTEREWQPIETASKDGAPVLGWSPEWGMRQPELIGWLDSFRYERAGWYTLDHHRFTKQPTHWMPLPDPPALAQAAPPPHKDV